MSYSRLLTAVLLFAASAAFAQKEPPPKLEPLPEPPPPAPGVDESLEPVVTIKKQGDDKVEEVRVNGKLVFIKVTPPHGKPYYLVDRKGDGTMVRQDSLDTSLRVPQWVLFQF